MFPLLSICGFVGCRLRHLSVSCENRGIGARRGLPPREIEVVSSVIIATLLCI